MACDDKLTTFLAAVAARKAAEEAFTAAQTQYVAIEAQQRALQAQRDALYPIYNGSQRNEARAAETSAGQAYLACLASGV